MKVHSNDAEETFSNFDTFNPKTSESAQKTFRQHSIGKSGGGRNILSISNII
jgi:hypothetical protein